MKLDRLVFRTAAVVVPAALVLGSAGAALAAKPPRTPDPTVTSTPAKVSSSKTASFAWATVANTTYTCNLDGSAYSACSSPTSLTNLTDRVHTFGLRAKITTPANSKASSYSYSWTVDTVAPVAPVVTPIAGPTSNTTASVTFTDSDTSVAGFTCQLDDAAPVACTSPQPYTGLTEATHTVVVAAHDAAGNTSTGSVTWTVDATAPNIPVLTGPANPTNDPDASVAFTGDGSTYICALDAEDPAPCTSPWTRTGLGDGSHTLTVTPFDDVVPVPNAGAPGTATWVVDTVAPEAPVLVSAPASTTNDPVFTVRFSDTDLSVASHLCSFQGGAFAPCTSPFTPVVSPISTTYGVDVKSVDLAGNASSALSATWAFDNAAPSPAEFLSGPSTPTNVADPVFDFVDTDTSTVGFACALDAGSYSPCNPGDALSSIAPGVVVTEGAHTLHVTASDAVPNTSAPVDWHWVLDTTGPASQPNAGSGIPPSSGPVTSTPTFVFTSNDPTVAGFVCKLDGALTWTPCASGYAPFVGDGDHTLQVATVDQAGNPGTPIVYTWTLDTTAPLGAVTFPTTLNGAVKVLFPEGVLGVSTTTAKLRVYKTTTVPAVRLGCLDATNHAVSCTGSVRGFTLTPVARLVPGQKYFVSLSSAAHDVAGNVAKAPTTVFRAQRLVQESDLSAVQGWALRSATAAYGGKYLQARLPGAQVSYPFKGTSVTWFTATGPTMGKVNVYCGSTFKGTVNNYAATATWRVARAVKCSTTSASNTLRLVATGLKGSTAGKGTNVVVDAVKLGTVLTTNPVLVQRWGTVATTGASGGRYGVADQAGEVLAMTFRGTSVTWRTLLGKNMGKAKVYIDGVYKGTYDDFATTTKAYTRKWATTDALHTIRIVLTGTHRTGATGTRVVVDCLTVG